MYCALAWKQDFTVTVGVVFAFLEISTPFVCVRWFLFKHGITGGSFLQTLNTFLLFFFFIFGRVVVQIYVVIWFNLPWLNWMWFEKEGVELLYKLLLVELFIAVLINVVLNFWWSYLITAQVIRTITRGEDNEFSVDSRKHDEKREQAAQEKQKQVEMAKILDENQVKSD